MGGLGTKENSNIEEVFKNMKKRKGYYFWREI